MKRKLLMLVVPILGSFYGFSQAEITITAPSATTGTSFRAPNGTSAHTTMRGVIIVPASELTGIPASTLLTKLGLLVSTAGGPGPADGTIEFYLENTSDVTNLKPADWATIIAPMTSVYSGTYSLPAVAGPTGDLALSTPFTYTGGSLYVAFDYLGTTFTTTACVYSANSSIGGGWRGIADPTTTSPANLTQTSAFRPCFRFTFTNPFTNELNISGLAGEKGIFNNTIKTTQTVTSFVSNTSQGTLTNIPVSLTVAGANPISLTQTITSIAAGATATVLFNNVPTSSLGIQTLTVSVPADQNNSNNSRTFNQKVQCDTISYVQTPIPSGAVGFNTGAGLIGVRHDLPSTVETYVKSVSNYFPTTSNNAGNTMKGILLNGSGVILDSTNLITITAGMLGTKQNFNFLNGAIDVSGGVIYVGFRQNANATTGYFPFANQSNSYVDPNAAATFDLFGGATTPLGSSLGYMMIEATLTYGGFDVPNSSSGGSLCMNSTLDITAPSGYGNYEFFMNGSSVQNGVNSSFSSGPLAMDTTFNVNITNGTCLLYSNVHMITIADTIINNISAEICQGESFPFGSQTLNTGGIYSDTLASVFGCDSVVVLNLIVHNLASGTDVQTTCGPFTWIDGITYTSSTSIATFNIVGGSSKGCDSLVTLNLTVNGVSDLSTTVSGATITASNTGATYKWLDCNNNYAVIPNQVGQSFTPPANGNYAVELTQNGCVDTSACVNIANVGILENSFGNGFVVYPNPTKGNFSVDLGEVYENAQISISDISGKLIETKTVSNAKVIQLSIKESAGVYFVSVLADNKNAVIIRLMKK